MLDIHSHILPGLDDGARDMDEALSLVKAACADGVRTIVATPHVMPGSYDNTGADIAAAVERLRGACATAGIAVEIISGAELYMDPALDQRLALDPALAIAGGPCVLIELPMQGIPPYAAKVLASCAAKGYIPIIAHPERNGDIIQRVDAVIPLIGSGAFLQVNAGSVMGFYGKDVMRTARALIERRMVSFMGSDMHDGTCQPLLSTAVQRIAEWIGHAEAAGLVTNTIACDSYT